MRKTKSNPAPADGQPAPGEDRASRITRAALQTFLENGFAGTRLDDVAARAGVAKGTIYLYFDSKEALFEAAVTSQLGPFLDAAEEEVARWDGTAADLLRQVGGHFRAIIASDAAPQLIRLILAEAPAFPAVAKRYHEAVISRGLGFLRATLTLGVQRGEWPETRLRNFPQIVAAPMVLGAIWKVAFDTYEPIDMAAYVDTHIETLIAGLKAGTS